MEIKKNVIKTTMKLSYYLTVILLFSGILTFSSCGDDNNGPSPDVNNTIVGVWQIAGEDLNGDGAIQGIVVHEDGTVTGWLYTASEQDPYKFSFKTGKWSVNGNHYEMQLPKSAGSYYQVTVAGNNDSLMYLAYNGKTSVVPFHRLAKLPGDGDATLRLLESMKMSNFKMSDLTGYWACTGDDGRVKDVGIYIDQAGNVSLIGTILDWASSLRRTVQYHSDKVTLNAYLCTIPYYGTRYELYGVNDTVMLVVDNDGAKIEKFVRQAVPQEMERAEKIANSNVPDWLGTTWEAVHYKNVNGSQTSEDFDINENDWTRQFYRELVFSSDHQLTQKGRYGDTADRTFYVDNDTIFIAESMDDLINNSSTESWTIVSHSNDELILKKSWTGSYEIYTYKRKQ